MTIFSIGNGSVNNAIPTMESAMATRARTCKRIRATSTTKSGVQITVVEVRKADFEVVVVSRPINWKI
jgi:hypothetical protein